MGQEGARGSASSVGWGKYKDGMRGEVHYGSGNV